MGPLVTMSPEYSGSSARHTVVVPGFYLRYGRISVSNASGFVTRRSKDDVFRGLGIDLKNDDSSLRLNVALRIDGGRKSSDSSGLTGIQDVRRTLRARTSATWELGHGWKVATGWGADLLGRGGGNTLDFGVGHDRRLSDKTTWNISAGLSTADSRYLRSYYGIDEAESAATGLPVYKPGAGLRELNLSTGWRTEFDPRWVALWGGSVSRLLGPAALSPLTGSVRQWAVNFGIARRF